MPFRRVRSRKVEKEADVMRKFSGFLASALLAAAVMAAGCGPALDKTEIEQAANPVARMHSELMEKAEADKYNVRWYSYEDALVKARREGKRVMLVFYTTWCKWCKKFEAETIPDPEVSKLLSSDFVAVRIDAEAAGRTVHEMRRMAMFELADVYGVQSFPTVWFLEPDGSRAKELKGYLGPRDFRDYLIYIRDGEYKKREF